MKSPNIAGLGWEWDQDWREWAGAGPTTVPVLQYLVISFPLPSRPVTFNPTPVPSRGFKSHSRPIPSLSIPLPPAPVQEKYQSHACYLYIFFFQDIIQVKNFWGFINSVIFRSQRVIIISAITNCEFHKMLIFMYLKSIISQLYYNDKSQKLQTAVFFFVFVLFVCFFLVCFFLPFFLKSR